MIKLQNLNNSRTYSNPLVLLRGVINNSLKCKSINVCVNDTTDSFPVIECRFKIAIHLKQKLNKVRVWVEDESIKTKHELVMQLIFENPLNEKLFRIVYVTCDDGNGDMFECGTFQSPDGEDNCIRSAVNRISLNMLMAQCFFANTLPDYKHFCLELDDNNSPKVHVFKLSSKIEQIWSMSGEQLWNYVAQCIMCSELGQKHCKYVAVCSFTRYSSDNPITSADSFTDLIRNTKGYVSLGLFPIFG